MVQRYALREEFLLNGALLVHNGVQILLVKYSLSGSCNVNEHYSALTVLRCNKVFSNLKISSVRSLLLHQNIIIDGTLHGLIFRSLILLLFERVKERIVVY